MKAYTTRDGMVWEQKHPLARLDMMGFIPGFVSPDDPRPAREQFKTNYVFGGWQPFTGFKMLPNGDLKYPEDPPTRLLFEAKLRDETIRVYEHAWVVVMQPDGTWEVSRMD